MSNKDLKNISLNEKRPTGEVTDLIRENNKADLNSDLSSDFSQEQSVPSLKMNFGQLKQVIMAQLPKNIPRRPSIIR